MSIVMKFGGSSVGSPERIKAVGEIVRSRLEKKPIVVVSAMKGVTDLLLESGKKNNFEEIKKKHLDVMEEFGIPEESLAPVFKELEKVLSSVSQELSSKEKDLVSSFGERLSARQFAAYLQTQKMDSTAFDAFDIGLTTDSNFLSANVVEESFEKINAALRPVEDIPVVTGFIAKDSAGNITTLGRGGSDYTAALLGKAVKAEAIEIWTDVNGIMSTDPRIVSEAKTLPIVSFNEAAELAFFGAKVLHPKTIEPAVELNIPVKVLNSFEPENRGTTILKESEQSENTIKAIALKQGVTHLTIHSTRMLDAPGFMARVFNVFEKYCLDIDMIATSEVSLSLTLNNPDKSLVGKAVKELNSFSSTTVSDGKSMVCAVGEGLRETPGLAGRMFSALGSAGINVTMISSGGSAINSACVVDEKDSEQAVKVLHKEFVC